jgi:hypothetical protein
MRRGNQYMSSRRQFALRLGSILLPAISLFAPQMAQAVTSGGILNGQGIQIIGGSNAFYYKQPSAGGSPITVLQNGAVGVGLGLYYPHSYFGTNDGQMDDTTFYNLVSGDLVSGANWIQDSLIIQQGGCFSGGFIDEFDNGNAQKMEIGTASWWGGTATAVESVQTKQYYNTQNDPYIKALTAGKNLLDAYSDATSNNPFSDRDLPQYFSSSNAMDAAKIGSAANAAQLASKAALVFVGSVNGPNDLQGWNDAVNFTKLLLNQGYTANNISFYFADGSKPASQDAFALPNGITIKGAANTDRVNAFFDGLKGNSTNAQVVVWNGSHGGLINEFKGLASLTIAKNGAGNLQFNFQVGSNPMVAFANQPIGNAVVQINGGGITGMTAGDKFDVVLKDPQGDTFDLGTITSDGNPNDAWALNAPAADLQLFEQHELAAGDLNGDIQIEFANYNVLADPDPNDPGNTPFAGNYSNIAIDDFSIAFEADSVVSAVPEPASVLLLALGTVTLIPRRRTRKGEARSAGEAVIGEFPRG